MKNAFEQAANARIGASEPLMSFLDFTLGLWGRDARDGAGRWSWRAGRVESVGWAGKEGRGGGVVSRAFEWRSGLGWVGLGWQEREEPEPGFVCYRYYSWRGLGGCVKHTYKISP
jgi:hypothetical protein